MSDVILFIGELDLNFCTGEVVNNVTGSGVTTPMLDAMALNTGAGVSDYVGVAAGTYQASASGNRACPSAAAAGQGSSAALAFKAN